MQPRKVVQDWRMPLLCLCPPADEMLAFLQHTFCIPASGPVVTDHSLDLFLVLQCCSICFYSPGCFGSLQSLRPCKDGAQGTIGLSFVSKHSWHLWNQRAWTMRPEERIEAPSVMAGFQAIILLHVLATARQCVHLAWSVAVECMSRFFSKKHRRQIWSPGMLQRRSRYVNTLECVVPWITKSPNDRRCLLLLLLVLKRVNHLKF